MRCDVIAQGIVMAVKDLDLKIPIVVRLQGECASIHVKHILSILTNVLELIYCAAGCLKIMGK